MFKKFKVSTKIIIVILAVLTVFQFFLGLICLNITRNIGDFAEKTLSNLGEFSSNSSKTALISQSENNMSKLVNSKAKLADDVLNQASKEVFELSTNLEEIYKNKDNFKGYLPRHPKNIEKFVENNRNLTTDRAFSVDYYQNDNDKLPQHLQNELLSISNIIYAAKPIFLCNNTIYGIYLGTESGLYYKFSEQNAEDAQYDPRTRQWYKDAVNAAFSGDYQVKKNPVWQGTYADLVTGELCITCSKAFCDENGNVLGVIAVDMFLEDINAVVINAGSDGDYAFIIDQNGKIILHPEIDFINKNHDFNTDPINSNVDNTYKNVILNMLSGKTGTDEALINSKKYYISYSPMTTTGWSFGMAAEQGGIIKPAIEAEDTIKNEAEEFKSTIHKDIQGVIARLVMVLLVCFALVYGVSTFLAQKIVSPIKKLIKETKKIGDGDLSIELPIESQDEIGELSVAFNKMTKDLKSYIENLAKTTKEKEKVKSELRIAKKIQFSMLPCIFPAFPDRNDFDIYAIMDPAKEVGGDFYDFFFIDKENLALVIADVADKGISAALFMVISKILLKNQAQTGCLPNKVLEIVNNRLCENNEAGMFVTVFLGIFNIKTGKFTFSCAGHNPPLIYKKRIDSFEWLNLKKSFVLAAMPNIKYHNNEIYLKHGDAIFLYTDGVTEAMNERHQLFSDQKLYDLLNNPNIKKLSIKDIITKIREEVSKHSTGTERTDDITMLVLKNLTVPDDPIDG